MYFSQEKRIDIPQPRDSTPIKINLPPPGTCLKIVAFDFQDQLGNGTCFIRQGLNHGYAANSLKEDLALASEDIGKFKGGFLTCREDGSIDVHTGSESYGCIDPEVVADLLRRHFKDTTFNAINISEK